MSRETSRVRLSLLVILTFILISQIRWFVLKIGVVWALYQAYPNYFTIAWKTLQIPLCFGAVMLIQGTEVRSTFKQLGLRGRFDRALVVALVGTLPVPVTLAFTTGIGPGLELPRLVITGLASPFSEEVLYRGFLFGQLYLHARWPFWAAVVVSALPFGWGHLYKAGELSAPLQALGVVAVHAVAAAFFAWLYLRWDLSLWYPIGYHALINFWSYVFYVGDSGLAGPVSLALSAAGILALTLLMLQRERWMAWFRVR
jgi:membrane protease YdiL (CAAX protease family)